MTNKQPKSIVLVSVLSIVFPLVLSSCGGGGGGGGGDGRTTGTSIRLVHGAISLAPLEIVVPGEEGPLMLQRAAFAEPAEFVEIEDGPLSVSLQRANSPGASFRSLSINALEETEYTLFVFGGLELGSDGVAVLEEPVERPETGFARVQLLNGLEGASELNTSVAGSVLRARFGGSSGFLTLPAGPHTFVISEGESPVATVAVALADRGEATIVVSGSEQLGTVFSRVYLDLD